MSAQENDINEIRSQTFLRKGIEHREDGSILVDLQEPRAILIKGYNPLTREMKQYMLRVTKGGKLHLV